MSLIRHMNLLDIESIHALEQECFGQDAWSVNLLRGELNDPSKHYWTVFCDNNLVGYGGYAQILDEGHIMNIAVNPAYRNQGFATAILQKFFEEARVLGINSFTLEVREGNVSAKKLYEKNGFTSSGVRKGYYRDGEDCRIYWSYL